MTRRTPCSPLFPYTTLFRSILPMPGIHACASSPASFSPAVTRHFRHRGAVQKTRHGGGMDAERRLFLLYFCSRQDWPFRSEEHTSELQSRRDLVCRLRLEKK